MKYVKIPFDITNNLNIYSLAKKVFYTHRMLELMPH